MVSRLLNIVKSPLEDSYELNNLRIEREVVRERFRALSKEVGAILDNLALNKNEVTKLEWKDLEDMPLGTDIVVDHGVRFVKEMQTENEIIFTTYMDGIADFGMHLHTDCIETIEILEGSLIEKTRGDKVYSKGEKLIYAENEKHEPKSAVSSIYKVTFNKA